MIVLEKPVLTTVLGSRLAGNQTADVRRNANSPATKSWADRPT